MGRVPATLVAKVATPRWQSCQRRSSGMLGFRPVFKVGSGGKGRSSSDFRGGDGGTEADSAYLHRSWGLHSLDVYCHGTLAQSLINGPLRCPPATSRSATTASTVAIWVRKQKLTSVTSFGRHLDRRWWFPLDQLFRNGEFSRCLLTRRIADPGVLRWATWLWLCTLRNSR